MNNEEFGSGKLLKLKYQRVDQINQTLIKIDSPQKLSRPSLISRNFMTLRKAWSIDGEWTEIQWMTNNLGVKKGGPNNAEILKNWFPPEIKCPLFNFYKFENSQSSTPESYKLHWKLINGEEFGS